MQRTKAAAADDTATLTALRAGDEAAFAALVERYHPVLLRIASAYVPSRAVAEEVVQEAWIGVLNGIDGFEGRSSLKTWIVRIVMNIARSRGQRESRSVPFSSLPPDDEPAVPAERFLSASHPTWPDHWDREPVMPEAEALSAEALDVVRRAIETLPPGQRAVITLRDVEGWSAEEVCNALEIERTNQRVLLHRARSRVRAALEKYLDAGAAT